MNNSAEVNLKRLQALKNLKNLHKVRKILIKQALANINGTNKKIIFDNGEVTANKSDHVGSKSKKDIFDDDIDGDAEDDIEPNFENKQFQGEKGQKLLELQSTYKHDKRFNLDARFLEENEQEETVNLTENNDEASIDEEKKMEYKVLGEILGEVLHKPRQKTESGRLLRFDPTNPEHLKFTLKNEVKKEEKRKKSENSKADVLNEKKYEEREIPEVSTEKFYKITDELKDSMKDKQEFSLLSMFGKAEEKVQEVEETSKEITRNKNNFMKEKNPFRYDSSEDEEEIDIPSNEEVQQKEKPLEITPRRITDRNAMHEPFFFTDDDYRLQEGEEFVERLGSQAEDDFPKLRRELKKIVRAKVRNNQRKNRPFKKKLGGNKKKKMLRIKKALKR